MRILKWIAIVALGLMTLFVVGCSTLILPRVSAKPANYTAEPDLLGPINGRDAVRSLDDWETDRAPFWLNILLNEVYGSIPPHMDVRVTSEEILSSSLLDGKATLKAVKLQFGESEPPIDLDLHVVIPNTPGPHPLILGASFCPNHSALPFDGVEPPDAIYPGFCDGESWATPIFKFIFGRHIASPPLQDIVDHGFAFGAYYPGQIVPDSETSAPDALDSLPKGDMAHGPYAAIGVWAWAATEIVDYVETDPDLDESRIILFGHSRYGKSSLLAGVLDQRIAGVISHQSGTGGASLQKNDVGESIKSITKGYSHWFAPKYATYAEKDMELSFDQHALVALMAPRPLLLGNSTRDQWSDPKGAFASAEAAGEVYRLYGEAGFEAETLKDFDPDAKLAFEFRGGTHGITSHDWKYFLQWLDAQFAN